MERSNNSSNLMEDHSLFERIDALKSDLKSYGDEIISIVKAQYDNGLLSPIDMKIDMKNDPRNAIFILRQDFSDIVNEKINLSKELKTQIHDNITDCENSLVLLENISKICDLYVDIDNYMTGSRLSAISKALHEVEAMLTQFSDERQSIEYSNGYVCKLLKSEYNMFKQRYYARLRRLLDNCVLVGPGKISITKCLSGVIPYEENILDETIRLEDIWNALISIGSIQECIDTIIQSIWINLIKPLYKERKSVPIKANITIDTSEFQFEFSNKISELSNHILNSVASGTTGINGSSSTTIGCINPSDSDYNNENDNNISISSVNSITPRMSIPNFIELISHMIGFVFTEVFCGMDRLSPHISNSFIMPPTIFVTKIYDAIILCQPKIESELLLYRKSIEKPLKELEKKMLTFGLTSPNNKDLIISMKKLDSRYEGILSDEPFSVLLENMNETFIDSRRKEILNQGREYILSDYHNIMLASGDALEDEMSSAGNIGDPQAMLEQSGSYAMQALQFDPCQISLASCRLLKLIHDVLKQTTDASSMVAKVLIQSTRDCLELFLFMIPVKYAEILSTSPRMAAVFYNDCLYISHNTTLITHIYRTHAEEKHAIFGYIDMIPRFRSVGEQILSYHIDHAKKVISEYVFLANINPLGENDGNGSGDNTNSSSSSSNTKDNISSTGKSSTQANHKRITITAVNNEQAVGNLINHFIHLHDQWHDVMQETVYERIIGHLIETMLRQFMEPLLSVECTCITESAAADISRLFRSLQKLKLSILSDGLSLSGDDYMKKLSVISWSKFCSLTDLLEYSLTDIAEWLPRKKFSSFTSQQLSNLIKALFEDTPKRQSLLTSIVDISN